MKFQKFSCPIHPLYIFIQGTFFILILNGCSAPDDTRQKVPVVMGIRLSQDIKRDEIRNAIPVLKETGTKEILIEFPLRAQQQDNPAVQIDSNLIQLCVETAQLLHKEGFKISLAICNSNNMEVFPEGKSPDPEIWFPSLEKLADTLLVKLAPLKIQRIIFGKNLLITEFENAKWESMFTSLRKKYPVKISYASDIERIHKIIPILAASDEIVICYNSRNPERMIPYNRENNHLASELADSLQKPVFIFQGTLLGDEPQKIFDFRLKFWNAETVLNGITINSIYPRFAITDTFVYYGLAKQKIFLKYLGEYNTVKK